MDLRRLRAGEWIAAASGVVLIVSLFLPWYEGTSDGAGTYGADATFTAWEVLAVLDVVFLIVGLLGIAVLVVTATERVPALPVALGSLTVIAGFIGTALVLFRLLAIPDLEAFSEVFFPKGDRQLGVWLALLATAGMTAGSFLAIRDERLSRPGETTDVSGRPVPPPPEIEPLPPPGPAT
jgi:hypothetical protein